MDSSTIDWPALERLRTAFLDGTAGQADYWRSATDLASYDATFAQRIGWKWDCVLGELQRRGWTLPNHELLDWGCGSGVAARAVLDSFGAAAVAGLRLWDRSPLAMDFAARRARAKYAALRVSTGLARDAQPEPFTLVLSHVLTELDEGQLGDLLTFAASATAILWIEPGTHAASRALGAVRERLVGRFNVVAPCTHQSACGMLAPGNERHWCHQFAASPPEVFTDGSWARFAQIAGIDLRRLPLSFLVLDRRAAPAPPADAVRVIGAPRVYKAYALLFTCDASGVRDRRMTKRHLPEAFRELKKGQLNSLLALRCESNEVIGVRPFV